VERVEWGTSSYNSFRLASWAGLSAGHSRKRWLRVRRGGLSACEVPRPGVVAGELACPIAVAMGDGVRGLKFTALLSHVVHCATVWVPSYVRSVT
jgi:hypothetical protein